MMAKRSREQLEVTCKRCKATDGLEMDFYIAFQPIVDCLESKVIGYEALVRGKDSTDAESILKTVNLENRYAFDQMCRVKAIEQAAQLGLHDKYLSINFLPNAIFDAKHCVNSTLNAARASNFPIENIIFEFTEVEKIRDIAKIKRIIDTYKNLGFKTAIDDFGAGFAGLGLLAEFQTDIVKIDMALIRNINDDLVRQTILTHSLNMLNHLNINVIAEGIESFDEMRWLRVAGVRFMQGFYFARPEIDTVPEVQVSSFNMH